METKAVTPADEIQRVWLTYLIIVNNEIKETLNHCRRFPALCHSSLKLAKHNSIRVNSILHADYVSW